MVSVSWRIVEVLLTDDKFENFEEFVMYGKIENSEEVLRLNIT